MPGGYDWTSLSMAILLVPVAYASTNIDNLLIMAALAGGRASRAAIVTGFILASLVVLIVSASAIVIEALIPPVVLGYLGLVPISIGLYLLLAPASGDDGAAVTAATWPAITGLLVANSSDTMFALGPLFAESGTSARIGLAAGFVLVAALWLALILGVSSKLARSRRLARIAPRIAPWMMILIGLYILSDSATDVI
jgi:cadmium resistance protein CadD (predicted permease)